MGRRVRALPLLESCFYHCNTNIWFCSLHTNSKKTLYLLSSLFSTQKHNIEPWRLHVKTISWHISTAQCHQLHSITYKHRSIFSSHETTRAVVSFQHDSGQSRTPGKWLANNVLENANVMDASLKRAVTTCILFITSL